MFAILSEAEVSSQQPRIPRVREDAGQSPGESVTVDANRPALFSGVGMAT
jgi:hypothetical protein